MSRPQNKRQDKMKTLNDKKRRNDSNNKSSSFAHNKPSYSFQDSGNNAQKLHSTSTEEIPLESNWSFWFDKYIGPGKSAEEYANALLQIGTFDSIQGFWQWYNNLPRATLLEVSSSVHLMKANVKPVYEDPSNEKGGHIAFKSKNTNSMIFGCNLLCMRLESDLIQC